MVEIIVTVLVIVIGLLGLIYFFIKNIAKGAFRSFVKRQSTDGAFLSAPLDSPWSNYIEIMNDNVVWLDGVSKEDVYIDSYDGLKLHGFYLNNDSNTTVIYFHSYRSKAYKEGAIFAKLFTENKYNVLIVEQRAHDLSEGDYVTMGTKEGKDVDSWVDYISNFNGGDIYLVGSSMGACAVIKGSSDKVKAIILDSADDDIFASLFEGFASIKFVGKLLERMVRGSYKKICMIDTNVNPNYEAIKKVNIPVLFIYGANDYLVTANKNKQVIDNCLNKEVLIVEDGLHISSIYTDYECVSNKIISFITEN